MYGSVQNMGGLVSVQGASNLLITGETITKSKNMEVEMNSRSIICVLFLGFLFVGYGGQWAISAPDPWLCLEEGFDTGKEEREKHPAL